MSDVDAVLSGVTPSSIPATELAVDNEEKSISPVDSEHTAEQENTNDEGKDTESMHDASDTEIDEYGNETPKNKKTEKTYTEAEVQAMIRDRLSRGKYAEQQQTVQEPKAQDFNYDESSEQSWEQQLEQFMENVLTKREQKIQQQQWQQQEQAKQAEFEAKFNQGMSKYADFREIVANQPIDDTMLLATRGMKDPAAFLYAASKTQAAELQRIAQIQDPYVKMAEVGRLDEHMKKQRAQQSRAPKPPSITSGDMVGSSEPKSIDDKIRRYAEKNLKR